MNTHFPKIPAGPGKTAEADLLGIDIGGTKTAFVRGDRNGTVTGRREIQSRANEGYAAMAARIRDAAAEALSEWPGIKSIGVSIGGPVDVINGLVLSPPHLPGWDAIPLAMDMADWFGLPVRVEHDAKACALAEWRFGAGAGTRNMVFLTLGTGIGAGIIADGRLLRGNHNLAGEIGHWRVSDEGPEAYGKTGSLEAFASGSGIAKLARHRHPDTFAAIDNVKELAELAAGGDRDAIAVIHEAGSVLGRSIAKLVDFLAPEMVVLGGLAHRLGAGFIDPLTDALRAEALPALLDGCQITLGKLGPAVGDYAALAVACEQAGAARTSPLLENAAALRTVLDGIESIDAAVERATEAIVQTLENGGRILVCGNGGSAAEGQHFVTELIGRYKSNRSPLPAIWLGGDTGQMSCIANDFSWDEVFSRPLTALARSGDILLCMSTSGTSINIVRALDAARTIGIQSVALLGNPGDAAERATFPVVVGNLGTARSQELHLLLVHTICDTLEKKFPMAR